MNDIKNLSDKELIDFLKRYWKTKSFNFYGQFVPEQRVASFYCGYIKHVKVPGSSIYLSYPFIRKTVEFKVPARFRIKVKGFYKFSCVLAPLQARINSNNYSLINLELKSLTSINEALYKGNESHHLVFKQTMNNNNEEEWFQQLHKIKENDVKTFNKKDYKGVWESVINKYPESAHFIYELLQNADDAQAENAYFILRKDGLVFAHNGRRHFNITDPNRDDEQIGDINSIVNIGRNEKDGIATIGKFGVGFKSVFQYTDCPEIYDDTFKFKITDHIVPTLLNHDFHSRKEGETLFYIPFKDKDKDYGYIKNRLNGLKSPILFLYNLREVKWKEESDISFQVYSKDVREIIKDEKKGVECFQVTERTGSKQQDIYMFKRNILVSENNVQPIYIGFYLKEDGTLDTKTVRRIFCFFQTSETFGMPFISHAPFLTVDNRNNLNPNSDINKYFINEIAKLAADSLVYLRDIGLKQKKAILTENLFEIIPVKYSNHVYTEGEALQGETLDISVFYRLFTEKVKTEKIIYTVDGQYQSIYNVILAERTNQRTLIDKNQLNFLLEEGQKKGIEIGSQNSELDTIKEAYGIKQEKKEFIKDSISSEIRSYMTDVLKIPRFTLKLFADCISPEFMRAQSQEWVQKFYEFIQNFWSRNDTRLFFCSPIIKTSNGTWESPYNEKGEELVYLPMDEKNEYSDAPYNFVSTFSYLKFPDFFEKTLELSRPNVLDFVRTTILPHYKISQTRYKKEMVLSDFYSLLHIYFDLKDKEEGSKDYNNVYSPTNFIKHKEEIIDINDLTDLISDNVLFRATNGAFYNKNQLFEGNDALRSYFGKSTSYHEFDLDFYANNRSEWNIDKIYTFIHAIGINKKHPQLLYCVDNQGTRIYCDYMIADFEIAPKNLQTSLLIWKSVINNSDIFDIYLHYRNQSEQTHKFRKIDHYRKNSLYRQLHDTPWITKGNGDVCLPEDISSDEFHSLGYKQCEEIESQIEVGKAAKVEQARLQALAEEQQRNDNNAIINLYDGNLEKAQKAKAFYDEINEKGISFDLIKQIIDIITNKEEDTTELNASSTLTGGDMSDSIDEIKQSSRANVIKTEHYIGLKLYEGYLKKKGRKYKIIGENNAGYDINVSPNTLINVSVIQGKEINTERFAPIRVTSAQHGMMHSKGNNCFTIVRIALKDLGLNFDKEIRSIFGGEADIDADEFFKKRCDKFAENYWKGKSTEEFENLTVEYKVQITREL